MHKLDSYCAFIYYVEDSREQYILPFPSATFISKLLAHRGCFLLNESFISDAFTNVKREIFIKNFNHKA